MAKTKIKDLSLTGGASSKSTGTKVKAPFAPPTRASKATANIAADVKGGATRKPNSLAEMMPGTPD
jgi:hypothetical protein